MGCDSNSNDFELPVKRCA